MDLWMKNRTKWAKLLNLSLILKLWGRERCNLQNKPPTCSMTSGAIQHGVPTNVFRTLFRVMSPPVAKKALTPKSTPCVYIWVNETGKKWRKGHVKLISKIQTNYLLYSGSFALCITVCIRIAKCNYIEYHLMVDGEKTLYQQFALSHHPQAKYFQPLHPCAWREERLNRHKHLR